MEMAEFDRQSATPQQPGRQQSGPQQPSQRQGEPRMPVGDELQTRFGTVPRDADREIRFRGGLPGFPKLERFQLDPIPGIASELMVLQAVEAAEVGFITMPLSDEAPVIREADIAEVARMLDIERGELLILATVTLVPTPSGVEKHINLRAPLFIDVRRKVGAQVVLANADYPLRYRVPPEAA